MYAAAWVMIEGLCQYIPYFSTKRAVRTSGKIFLDTSTQEEAGW